VRDWKDATSLPAWRGRPSRPRVRRRRVKEPVLGFQFVEEYVEKSVRDAVYADLRARKVSHVAKFSTGDGTRDIWCIARPKGSL
jgi:hypothetical protein